MCFGGREKEAFLDEESVCEEPLQHADREDFSCEIPQRRWRTDRLSIVQIEQDVAVCAHKFPSLICRPVSAQFMKEGVIALIEFGEDEQVVGVVAERHYRLVPPDQITNSDLENYRKQIPEGNPAKA